MDGDLGKMQEWINNYIKNGQDKFIEKRGK